MSCLTTEKWKLLLEKLVNFRECHSFGLTLLNCHDNEGNIAVGWFLGASGIGAVLFRRGYFLVIDVQ